VDPVDVDEARLANLAADNAAFALDLHSHLAAENGSLFLAPYSISVALTMTFAGARGETREQMRAFAEEYLALVEEHHGAGLRRADFVDDPGGERERIDEWIADRTDDRIEALLPPDSIGPRPYSSSRTPSTSWRAGSTSSTPRTPNGGRSPPWTAPSRRSR